MTTDTPAAAPITAELEQLARIAFEHDAKQRDGGVYDFLKLSETRTATGYINPSWNGDWKLWWRAWNAALSAPVAASGVSALWVEEAEQLADNAINAHATWFAECALGELSNFHMPHLESEKDAAREALRAHLSTALTGAATKE
jgi:hypothetical protein